tara:strand:- start:500 stop:778 length:279 start_codon:yes stop_codon:yes gene_type:complete
MNIKNSFEYKNFLDSLDGLHNPDNFMVNFLHAFNRIGVGCRCRLKSRLNIAESKRIESINNLTENFKKIAFEKHGKINFYNNEQLINSINYE